MVLSLLTPLFSSSAAFAVPLIALRSYDSAYDLCLSFFYPIEKIVIQIVLFREIDSSLLDD